MRQTRVYGSDDDDADMKTRDVLLILKTLIGRYEYVKCLRRAAQQLAVLNGCPAFFLNRPNLKLRQITPELPWHIFIEENTRHAI